MYTSSNLPTAIIIIQKGERRNLWFPIKRREIHQKRRSNDGASPFYFICLIIFSHTGNCGLIKGGLFSIVSCVIIIFFKTIACTHLKSYNAHWSSTFSLKKSLWALWKSVFVFFWITKLYWHQGLYYVPFDSYSLVGWNNRIITDRFFPFLDVRCCLLVVFSRTAARGCYTQENNILSTKLQTQNRRHTHTITDKSPQHFSRERERGGGPGFWVLFFFFSGDGWDDGWMRLLFSSSCIVVLLLLQHWIYRADDGCRGFLRALLRDRSNSS